MRFFTPQGLNVAPMGVKFGVGVEEETEGSLFRAKFHPIGATIGYSLDL